MVIHIKGDIHNVKPINPPVSDLPSNTVFKFADETNLNVKANDGYVYLGKDNLIVFQSDADHDEMARTDYTIVGQASTLTLVVT